jgi:hypothetical protein
VKITLLAFLILFTPLTLAGNGFVNPDFAGKSYHHVIVSVLSDDLEYREMFEKRIAREINDHGGHASTYLSLLSPAKKYTQEEIAEILQSSGADAVLVVNIGDVQDERKIGGTLAQTKQIGYTATTTTQPMGMRKKSLSATATLFDAKSGNSAWVGSSNVTAKGLHALSDGKVIGRLADDLAEKLKKSGLLAQ